MINIVGNGLAGSITARFLEDAGYEVRIIADDDPFAASTASSNLYIEHWVKKFTGSSEGLKLIQEKWGDRSNNPFATGLGYAAKVKHVNWEDILRAPDIEAQVTSVQYDNGRLWAKFEGKPNKIYLGGEATILCLGYRNAELVPHHEVDVKAGHCLLFDGVLPEGEASISMVSPYRHQKWYQLNEDTIYYADSTALKLSRYTREREELIEVSKQRAEKLNRGRFKLIDVRTGYRPIMPGHDFGALIPLGDRTWMMNGGGKNGMVAYAACAQKLVKELEHAL